MISETELKQVVYAFKCNKSTLQVQGKLNSITLGENKACGLGVGVKGSHNVPQCPVGFVLLGRHVNTTQVYFCLCVFQSLTAHKLVHKTIKIHIRSSLR